MYIHSDIQKYIISYIPKDNITPEILIKQKKKLQKPLLHINYIVISIIDFQKLYSMIKQYI
jgi:hypothetical protein